MGKIGFKQDTTKDVEKVYKALKAYNKALDNLKTKDPDKYEEVLATIEKEENPEEEEGSLVQPVTTLEIAGAIYFFKRLMKGKDQVSEIFGTQFINTDYTPIQEAAVNNVDGHSESVEVEEDGEED